MKWLLVTGKQVLSLVLGAHLFSFDHDEVETEREAQLVGDFLQAARDLGDLGDDLGPREQIQASVDLSESIEELDRAGFFVFGGRGVMALEETPGGTADFSVAALQVMRKTNDAVIRIAARGDVGQHPAPEKRGDI